MHIHSHINIFFLWPKLKYLNNGIILVLVPLEISFTPVLINSTSIVLKIPTLDEEDKRYHYMFTVVLYENTTVASQVAETIKHKYRFETGVLTLPINNLTAFRNYEIILWTHTHQGYSKRAVESIFTPADGTSLLYSFLENVLKTQAFVSTLFQLPFS